MTEIWPPVWPVLAFVTATSIALALRAAVLAGLRRWPGGGPSVVGDAIHGPSLLWCMTLGLYAANDVALDAIFLPVRWHLPVELLLEAVLVLSVVVVLASMAGPAVARGGNQGLGRVRGLGARSTLARGLVCYVQEHAGSFECATSAQLSAALRDRLSEQPGDDGPTRVSRHCLEQKRA